MQPNPFAALKAACELAKFLPPKASIYEANGNSKQDWVQYGMARLPDDTSLNGPDLSMYSTLCIMACQHNQDIAAQVVATLMNALDDEVPALLAAYEAEQAQNAAQAEQIAQLTAAAAEYMMTEQLVRFATEALQEAEVDDPSEEEISTLNADHEEAHRLWHTATVTLRALLAPTAPAREHNATEAPDGA